MYVFTPSRRGFGDITTVAQTIQRIEGYYPGSVAYRNNNPGNLMYAGQPGATGADANGFAIFPTYDVGYQALLNQISLDASRGETIAQFTAKYAPTSAGNDPTSYAASIASAEGLSPSDLLSAAIGQGGAVLTTDSAPSLDFSSMGLDFSQLDPVTIALLVGAGFLAAYLFSK